MKIKWTKVLYSKDTAITVLNSIIRQRKNDIKNNICRKAYEIKEFVDEFSIDGEVLPNRNLTIPSCIIDRCSEKGSEKLKNSVLTTIAIKLALPYMLMENLNKSKKYLRTRKEIEAALEKAEKKKQRYLKRLEIFAPDLVESVPDKIEAQIENLKWCLTSDNGVKKWEDIANLYFGYVIEDERDRLFHYTRHKTKHNMNRSFNEYLIESIRILKWVMKYKPPKIANIISHKTLSWREKLKKNENLWEIHIQ